METPHLDKEIEWLEWAKNGTNWNSEREKQLDEYKAIKQALRIPHVAGRSEQLGCDKCGYPMFYHKPDNIMYCHGCENTKPVN